VKRIIKISKIASITHCVPKHKRSESFIVHVPSEYDSKWNSHQFIAIRVAVEVLDTLLGLRYQNKFPQLPPRSFVVQSNREVEVKHSKKDSTSELKRLQSVEMKLAELNLALQSQESDSEEVPDHDPDAEDTDCDAPDPTDFPPPEEEQEVE